MGVHLLRALLLLMLFGLQYQLWYGEGGIMARQRLEARIADLHEQNAALLARNEQLREQIRQLEEGGEALEEAVRRHFNWIRQEELLFVLSERQQ